MNLLNKIVIFVIGGKGGVGKTAFMTVLAEYFTDMCNETITMIDCDTENKAKGSFKHYFPQAIKVDIRKPDGLDIFIDAAAETEAPVVLADLGAGAGVDTLAWFKDMYPAANELGIKFLAVGCITENAASIESVFSWSKELQDTVDYLIVKNQMQGVTTLWDKSSAAKQFKEAFDPAEIIMTARMPEWQAELENHGLTLTAAMESSHPIFSKLSARGRLQRLRQQMFDQFDDIRNVLEP